MPKFSLTSFSKLSTCHPDLQAIFYEVIKDFDCIILEGHRDQASQEQAFLNRKTKLHWPDGKHNSLPSNAIDAAPYPLNWENKEGFYFFAGWVMSVVQRLKYEGKITHSVRWGGDWDSDRDLRDQDFNDLVHFELVI